MPYFFLDLSINPGHEGVALAMLDSMEHLLEGGGEFDRVFWDKLTTCWNETNTGYHEAQVEIYCAAASFGWGD